MAVKLRLQRHGRRKRPFYHIVVADSRAPRDGRYIEKIGTYNPMTVPATINLDRDKAFDWLMKGAQPTDTVRAMLRLKGVLYRKHLMRGVQKGALTEEAAIQKYNEWIADKEARLSSRSEKSAEQKRDYHKQVSGTAKPSPVEEQVEEVVNEAQETVDEAADSVEAAAEQVVEEVSEKVEESADTVEEKAEEVAKEASEVVENVKEKAEEIGESIAEAAGDVAENVKEGVDDAADSVKEALSSNDK